MGRLSIPNQLLTKEKNLCYHAVCMATPLRHILEACRSQVARDRVQAALLVTADYIVNEAAPAGDAPEEAKTLHRRRKETAQAVLRNSPMWVDSFMPRIMTNGTIQAEIAQLTSSLTTPEQDNQLDNDLKYAVSFFWNEFLLP